MLVHALALQAGGIWVDRRWRAKEGEHLTEDLVLGRVLGSGFQVRSWLLWQGG